MKIVAVMGSCRKNGAGARYLKQIENAARNAAGDSLEFEYLWLGDYDIQACRGCMVCYEKGEAACPLKDGYLEAMRKLNEAEAAVFYSPTYTLAMSGLMKTFFDRSSFVLHRPYFKGRNALVLTAVEAYGDKKALPALKLIVSMMGFALAGATGIVNMKLESSPAYRARVGKRLEKQASLLVRRTASGWKVRPSLIQLLTFQYQKATFGANTAGCRNDKKFWREAGWAKADAVYYCDARVSALRAWLAKDAASALKKSGLLA